MGEGLGCRSIRSLFQISLRERERERRPRFLQVLSASISD